TLRLVLHDLLLPTIWRTNPETTRGVGAMDVVVAPPFVRGRLRVAATLHVVDPELHRMQTEAGIAEEATPGHLCRSRDDPFPGAPGTGPGAPGRRVRALRRESARDIDVAPQARPARDAQRAARDARDDGARPTRAEVVRPARRHPGPARRPRARPGRGARRGR